MLLSETEDHAVPDINRRVRDQALRSRRPCDVEKSFVRNLGDLVNVRNVLSDRFLKAQAEREA